MNIEKALEAVFGTSDREALKDLSVHRSVSAEQAARAKANEEQYMQDIEDRKERERKRREEFDNLPPAELAKIVLRKSSGWTS